MTNDISGKSNTSGDGKNSQANSRNSNEPPKKVSLEQLYAQRKTQHTMPKHVREKLVSSIKTSKDKSSISKNKILFNRMRVGVPIAFASMLTVVLVWPEGELMQQVALERSYPNVESPALSISSDVQLMEEVEADSAFESDDMFADLAESEQLPKASRISSGDSPSISEEEISLDDLDVLGETAALDEAVVLNETSARDKAANPDEAVDVNISVDVAVSKLSVEQLTLSQELMSQESIPQEPKSQEAASLDSQVLKEKKEVPALAVNDAPAAKAKAEVGTTSSTESRKRILQPIDSPILLFVMDASKGEFETCDGDSVFITSTIELGADVDGWFTAVFKNENWELAPVDTEVIPC